MFDSTCMFDECCKCGQVTNGANRSSPPLQENLRTPSGLHLPVVVSSSHHSRGIVEGLLNVSFWGGKDDGGSLYGFADAFSLPSFATFLLDCLTFRMEGASKALRLQVSVCRENQWPKTMVLRDGRVCVYLSICPSVLFACLSQSLCP